MVKEFFQMVRDPSAFLISVVFPLLLLFLYGFGVSLDLKPLSVGVVVEETTPDTTNFLESFLGSTYFDVSLVKDRREVYEQIARGKLRGMVVFPAYFTQRKHRLQNTAPIQIVADGSEPNTAQFVQNYCLGAIQNGQLQEAISHGTHIPVPLIDVQSRFWYNEELESRYFLLPGSLAIIMTIIGTLLTALVVAREWERGTMEALLSTPLSRRELLFGKVVPYFFLGMVSMTLIVICSVFVFHVPLRGSLLALCLISSSFLVAALGLGLLISSYARNQMLATQVALITGFLPAYILSGFIFEIASMPVWIQCLTYLMPAKYFVSALLSVFLVGDIWQLLLINSLAMLLIGGLFFGIALRITKKTLD